MNLKSCLAFGVQLIQFRLKFGAELYWWTLQVSSSKMHYITSSSFDNTTRISNLWKSQIYLTYKKN